MEDYFIFGMKEEYRNLHLHQDFIERHRGVLLPLLKNPRDPGSPSENGNGT